MNSPGFAQAEMWIAISLSAIFLAMFLATFTDPNRPSAGAEERPQNRQGS